MKFMTTTFRKQEKMMKPDKNTTENSGNAKNSVYSTRVAPLARVF